MLDRKQVGYLETLAYLKVDVHSKLKKIHNLSVLHSHTVLINVEYIDN